MSLLQSVAAKTKGAVTAAGQTVRDIAGVDVPYKYANPVTSGMDPRVAIGPSPNQSQLKPDEPSMTAGPDTVTSNVDFFNRLLGHLTDLGMAGGAGVAAGVAGGRRGGRGMTEPPREARPVLEDVIREAYRSSEDTRLQPGENPIRASRPKVMEKVLRALPGQSGGVSGSVIGPTHSTQTEFRKEQPNLPAGDKGAVMVKDGKYAYVSAADIPGMNAKGFKESQDRRKAGVVREERTPIGPVRQESATVSRIEAPEPQRRQGDVQVRPAATNALLKQDYAKEVPTHTLTRSGFIDDDGRVIQINGTHVEALKQAGLLPKDLEHLYEMSQGGVQQALRESLSNHKLTRVVVDKNSFQPNISVEIAHAPSPKLLDAITQLSKDNPKAGLVYDLHNGSTRTYSKPGENDLSHFLRDVKTVYGSKE